jgi:MFS family permease
MIEMTAGIGDTASNRERRARAATTLIFVTVGWVYAAWATRIPGIKDDLGLSDGELGLAILGLEAGAILGLPAGGALVARIGSRRPRPCSCANPPATANRRSYARTAACCCSA